MAAKATKRPSLKRDEDGLLEGVDYIFDEDGFINWRAMIDENELYPNKDWFLEKDQAVPVSAAGLKDYQCLVKLGGLKKLLRLRGYKGISSRINVVDKSHVVASCAIEFIGNYETDGESVYYEANANATVANTSEFGEKFLETIAENRALVRCIRNFLNINICGADEVDKSGGKDSAVSETSSSLDSFTPQGALHKAVSENGIDSFDKFIEKLRELYASGDYRNDKVASWQSYNDIPAKEARILITFFKK